MQLESVEDENTIPPAIVKEENEIKGNANDDVEES